MGHERSAENLTILSKPHNEDRSRSPLQTINYGAGNSLQGDQKFQSGITYTNKISHQHKPSNSYSTTVAMTKNTSFVGSIHDSGKKSTGGISDNAEDIRQKLARYKAERENFELVRAQFRQKHKEIEGRDSISNSSNLGLSNTAMMRPDSGKRPTFSD